MNKQEIEKAIEYWKEFKSEIKDLRRGHSALDWNEQEKATDLAISALEKQIPKKPTDTWEKDIERQRRHLCRWACPDCGTFLGFENKHCTECGTKIKWDVIA